MVDEKTKNPQDGDDIIQPQDGDDISPHDGDDIQPQDGGSGIDKATADKWLAQRREANRQAKREKQRADKLEAELKAREEAELAEIDLAKKRAEEAEAARDAAIAEASSMRTKQLLLEAGIKPKFAKMVGAELSAAKSDEDFDLEEWMEKYKKDAPELFADFKQAAPATAGGGAGEQKPLSGVEKDIFDVKKKMETLTPGSRELFYLERRLKQLERMSAS
jgi:hypothetical protein